METPQRDVFASAEADAYFARNPIGDNAPSEFDHEIAKVIGHGSSVLEVGCADGRRLQRLAGLAPASYFGVDPSAVAIEHGSTTWPDLTLRVGSADAIPFDRTFDTVILGFFLYVCDRALLPRIVAEVDRTLADGGALAIIDFRAPYPSSRPYHHSPGLRTYRLAYDQLFLAYPSYSLVTRTFVPPPSTTRTDGGDDVVMSVLRKRLDSGYAIED